MTTSDDLADDLLWGCDEIARFIRRTKRQVYHAVSRGHLPVTKVGPILVARKSELAETLRAKPKRARLRESDNA
jgi:hypothetical protein